MEAIIAAWAISIIGVLALAFLVVRDIRINQKKILRLCLPATQVACRQSSSDNLEQKISNSQNESKSLEQLEKEVSDSLDEEGRETFWHARFEANKLHMAMDEDVRAVKFLIAALVVFFIGLICCFSCLKPINHETHCRIEIFER